jgi:hypothetical protein
MAAPPVFLKPISVEANHILGIVPAPVAAIHAKAWQQESTPGHDLGKLGWYDRNPLRENAHHLIMRLAWRSALVNDDRQSSRTGRIDCWSPGRVGAASGRQQVQRSAVWL